MICSNNLRLNSLIACFVVLYAVSLSQDLSPLLLEYPRFVAGHFSNLPKMAANLALLLFPKKIHTIFVLSFDMKICSMTNTFNFSDLKKHIGIKITVYWYFERALNSFQVGFQLD